MTHDKLKWIKDSIICVVENQLCNLEEVDTKELGEAIDMIKDLEEAIYYCTVTEAMNNPDKEWEIKKSDHHQSNDDSRMYYKGGYPMMYDDDDNMEQPHSQKTYDEREGHSHLSRKMYMEAKDMNKDKAIQLRELERYMQELSKDITEMIAGTSLDEKQYLEKKMMALASKIGEMK